MLVRAVHHGDTQHSTTTPLLQSTLSINSSGPNRFLFHLIEKVRLVFGYGGGGNKQILKNGASR